MEKDIKALRVSEPVDEKYNYQPPGLFSIPCNFERALFKRNKKYYVRVQRLEEKYAKFKIELLEYTKKKNEGSIKTRELIETTRYMLNRFQNQQRQIDLIKSAT